MRVIGTLLWRELESLFFAPMAYIILTILLVLNGVSFTYALQASDGNVTDTVRIFFGDGPLFWVCLMMVPALVTMRLVAEEKRSGTLEVLLTAPVRDREVIIAKFLGAMIFQVFLWAPTLIYVLILRRYGALPDSGQLGTAYLGTGCVTMILTAGGLLFSTLSGNQIVSALSSLVFGVLLLVVPLMIPSLQVSFLTGVAEVVSPVGHFQSSFSRGLLDTSVLTFYVASTLALLVLAWRSLEVRRWR